MGNFDQTKYKNDFAKENYDRLTVVVKKGRKDELAKLATRKKQSLGAFVKEALTKQFKYDTGKDIEL